MRNRDKLFSLPSVGSSCLSPFSNSELRKLVGLGNYMDIFTCSEPAFRNLPTVYGVTERGYVVCLTLSLSSMNRSIKVIDTLAESVVQRTLYSLSVGEHEESLHLCLAHDGVYITVLISLPKLLSLRSISNKNLVKVTVKSSNGLQPLSVFFSRNKKFVFACYSNSIDIFALTRGSRGLVPSLDHMDIILPKEPFVDSHCSRTIAVPSYNDDNFLYYLYKGEESKEVVEIARVKLTREETDGFSYNIKQVKVSRKASEARDIICIDVESRVKFYEWTNNMEKLALLLENNGLEVISTGRILKGFETNDPKLGSKDYQKELLQFCSCRTRHTAAWKSVNWLDHGAYLVAVSEDLRAYLFDSCLNLLSFESELGPVKSLPLFKLEVPKMKNKVAESIMSKEINKAREKLVFKRSILDDVGDPFIISGSLPYSLVVYKLGFTLPWKNSAVNEYGVVSQYLESGKVELALKGLGCIENPEVFIRCFVHASNYLMRRPKILANHSVINHLITIHKGATSNADMEKIKPLLNQYYHKLGQRLLTSDYYEEAYNIALSSESAILMRNIEYYCKWRGMLVMAEAAKKEAMKYDPTITTMAQEMAKVSGYTHKTLTAEDIQNIINDYNILMNVSSIHELDLDEFNSWEINLKEYEKALQLELEGNYEEARTIYERNKLSADAKRAENLAQITESMNQDMVQFTGISEVVKKDKK